MLAGVGEPACYDMEKWVSLGVNRVRVLHVRRRLTAAETERVGAPVDVRGSDIATRRLRDVAAASGLPFDMLQALESESGMEYPGFGLG